jgi:hypothetical protein
MTKQDISNTVVRGAAGLPAIVTWTGASMFALRWLSGLGSDFVSLGSLGPCNLGPAITWPCVSAVVLAGGAGSVVSYERCVAGAARKRWQAIWFVLGLLALWLIAGE